VSPSCQSLLVRVFSILHTNIAGRTADRL
jgi:hypothetical protein